MKIRKAKILFERLRQDILADRVVDWKETDELLDFIEMYVQTDIKPFVGFAEVLRNYRKDGKITPKESKILIEWIDRVYEYLDKEDKVDQAVCLVVKLLFGTWLVWLLVKVATVLL